MPRRIFVAALLAVAACTPTFNWREIAIAPAGLHTMFPCKPDQVEHKSAFSPGREVVLHATGCESGGAAFVVVYADMGNAGDLANALSQWKQASLATTKSTAQAELPFLPKGALGLLQSVKLRADGQRPDGTALQSQAAYFARGTTAFQAVVYSSRLKPEMTEPFFAGLRFE